MNNIYNISKIIKLNEGIAWGFDADQTLLRDPNTQIANIYMRHMIGSLGKDVTYYFLRLQFEKFGSVEL
jgi:hypothetical protein